MTSDRWSCAGRTLTSRLFLGTARYPSREVLIRSIEASHAEVVTVAIRRVTPQGDEGDLYSDLRRRNAILLPNTAGCYSARDAVLTAELAREALGTDWIKLEVIADEETLLPETGELLVAARELVRKGFKVFPYTNDDPVTARGLEDAGCSAIMPLGAPIGSGLGIRNPHNLQMIVKRAKVPVIVDAGVGTASDVSMALELGVDAVLLNTAVARADDPVRMAMAMGQASLAGRNAFLAGRIPKLDVSMRSSPNEGRISSRLEPRSRQSGPGRFGQSS